MKGLCLALKQGLILLFSLFLFNIPCSAKSQKLNYLGLLVNGTLEEKLNQIFSLMQTYYQKGDYEKVVEVYQQLPPFLPLNSEENLMIARSFLYMGEPQKAIKFADKILSLHLNTEVCCRARLVKIEALAIMGKTKKALQEIKALNKTFCAKAFQNEVKVILYYLGKTEIKKLAGRSPEVVKSMLDEIYQVRIMYLLKQKNLNQALQEAFIWLNIYGNYKKGSGLLFKIADAFFKAGQIEKANTLYELIITEWESKKEATFAKFRLYQIAYQRIKIKELIPQQMIDDLLFYIRVLKKKYPQEKITQDAHFFEVKLFFQYKKWRKVKKVASEFLSRYPKSPYNKKVEKYYALANYYILRDFYQKLPAKDVAKFVRSKKSFLETSVEYFVRHPKSPYARKAKVYYCKATYSILKNFYNKEALTKMLNLFKKKQIFLEKADCGNVFFFIGKIHWKYHFRLASTYYFIKAYEHKPPKKIMAKTLLYLGVIAIDEGEKNIATLLFSELEKNYGKILGNSPWYCYLKALFEVEKGNQDADIWLKRALNSELDLAYKEKLLKTFRNWALKRGEYEKALSYTLTKGFNPTPEDFILLLACSFSKDPVVFEKALKVAEKLYPKNFKIKWLGAYFYEKTGRIKQANQLWQEISSAGNEYENIVARNYEKFKKFLKEAQKLVF